MVVFKIKQMKKRILTLAAIAGLFASSATAQNQDYMHGVGLHFGTMQYNGDLANEYFSTENLHGAIGVSYNHYVNKALDATLMFSHGRIDHNSGPLNPSFKTNLYNFDLMLKYKFNNGYLLREDFPVAPFFHVGIGDAISTSNRYPNDNTAIDFNFPIGGGLVISPATRLSAVIQTTHHWTFTDAYDGWVSKVGEPNNDNFLFTSVGLNYNFNTIQDRDRDGVADDKDLCPDVKGTESANGCPDADNDGVADAEDKCKTLAGIAANKGCPKIQKADLKIMNMAMQGLFFKTGSATIEDKSYPVLDNVVAVMNRHPEYNLSIEGHTDNTGNADSNLKLSQDRAAAAAAYISGKGISTDRIAAAGYGQTKPIADNSTEVGRAKNRRVSFRITF